MTQTRVVIPESPPLATYNRAHTHAPPPSPSWFYREGLYPSYSRSSAGSGLSRHGHSPCPIPRRARTTTLPAGFEKVQVPRHNAKPWEHMAQTYAWVLEQEIAEMSRKNEETVRWVMEQQERDVRERTMFNVLTVENKYRQMMDELVEEFDREAERWKSREQQTRRTAMRWQRDIEKSVQEELRRLQAKRREAERQRAAYDRRRAEADARERERRRIEREHNKVAREEAHKEAWRKYEELWAGLNASSEELSFESIPWPMFSSPKSVEGISPARVTMFFLSPVHSDGQSRKDRIKAALRRWHPDRFGRVLARVKEDDRTAVEEGAGIIVRCLNNLMERQK